MPEVEEGGSSRETQEKERAIEIKLAEYQSAHQHLKMLKHKGYKVCHVPFRENN